ncbi:MAG TPA: hypothetical protein PLD84_05620 [Chitinophagales bacterium]|nr:hypothetical protein [Chitinophagales bacterium]
MPAASHLTQTPPATSALAASALKVLLYYDLFRYPLTAAEIFYHSRRTGHTEAQLRQCLSALCEEQVLFHHHDCYLLKDDEQLVQRRKKGNDMASSMLKKAASRAAFIAGFPYVRGVCVSGSLSKNYFDETTDIDFFIITAPNRLWLCRSLLILYKKIFLLNSKKYFCVNYFIDTSNLEIPDKNIFTATEIITLLPFSNHSLYRDFFTANQWVNEYYPHAVAAKGNETPGKKHLLKSFLEKIFDTPIGEWLDRSFYKATVKHWKKNFPDFTAEEFEVNMRSRKDVSKHHPQGFQFRVLKMYEENCRAFEAKHGISLH